MSMRELEREIITEVREIKGRRSIRIKDMLEWSTSEKTVRDNMREGEEVIHCPKTGTWVCLAKK